MKKITKFHKNLIIIFRVIRVISDENTFLKLLECKTGLLIKASQCYSGQSSINSNEDIAVKLCIYMKWIIIKLRVGFKKEFQLLASRWCLHMFHRFRQYVYWTQFAYWAKFVSFMCLINIYYCKYVFMPKFFRLLP